MSVCSKPGAFRCISAQYSPISACWDCSSALGKSIGERLAQLHAADIVVLAALLLGEQFGGMRLAATLGGFAGVLSCCGPDLAKSASAPPSFWAVRCPMVSNMCKSFCHRRGRYHDDNTLGKYSDASAGGYTGSVLLAANLDRPVSACRRGYYRNGRYLVYHPRLCNRRHEPVVPFDFPRLPLVGVAGWFLFNEPTDIWTVVGALVIFSSTYLLARSDRGVAYREKNRDKIPGMHCRVWSIGGVLSPAAGNIHRIELAIRDGMEFLLRGLAERMVAHDEVRSRVQNFSYDVWRPANSDPTRSRRAVQLHPVEAFHKRCRPELFELVVTVVFHDADIGRHLEHATTHKFTQHFDNQNDFRCTNSAQHTCNAG